MMTEDKKTLLTQYFKQQPDVLFAFLFGSRTKNLCYENSDWDIAVYFKPLSSQLEWEDTTRIYPLEDEIWTGLIKLLNTDNVDLVVLNRAAVNIADIAIRGLPLLIRDKTIFWEFILRVTNEADNYREFVDDFFAINQRSASLSAEDKSILKKTIIFALDEITSYASFQKMSIEDYKSNADKRRNVERWIENIMNALIDMAKIILGSEKKPVPNTYREALEETILFLNLSPLLIKKFERWAKLRNILAHEYLDIKWERIKEFIKDSQPYVVSFIDAVKKFTAHSV